MEPDATEEISLEGLRRAAIRVLGEAPGVAAAYAYGSRISGRPLPLSDLDVAFVLRADEDPDDPLLAERLGGRIAAELGAAVAIDAHLARHLPLVVRGRVVTTGALLYDGDPVRRVEFETSTRRLYFDFLPLVERDAREGLRALGGRGPRG